MMVVRELVALLGIKTDKKGFDQAEGGMNRLLSYAKAAAVAFAAFKIGKWAVGVADEIGKLGDQFDKLSRRTGVSFDKLQQLEHAAELSGASLADIETGLRRLQASQVDAAAGLATYTREFERLGVEVKNADGTFKDTTELLFEMADGMTKLESDAERTAVATKLLGRGGAKLIPMFAGGADAMREMFDEVHALGGLMDGDLRKASANYIDNQRRMTLVTRGLKMAIGKALLPVFNKMYDATFAWWKINGEWIRQNVGAVFKVFGNNVKTFADIFGGLAKVTVEFVKNMTPLEKGILKIGVAVTVLGALIMAGPIGKLLLLATVIGLVIDDFRTWQEGGDSVIGLLIAKLDEFLGIDFVETVKSWWDAYTNYLGWMWDAISGLVKRWAESLAAITLFFINVWENPKKAFSDLIDGFKEIWGDWITRTIVSLGDLKDRVIQWVKDIFDILPAPLKAAGKWVKSLLGGGDEGAPGDAGKPGPWMERNFGPLALTPDELAAPKSIPASAGGKSVSFVNQPQTTVNVDIKPGAGQSPRAIGGEVAAQVRRENERSYRAAMKSFVSAAS